MNQQIENNFTYHKPLPGQPERYAAIRDKAKELANLIDDETPKSREQSLALTNLEQAVFWANAAIARNEKAPADAFTDADGDQIPIEDVRKR